MKCFNRERSFFVATSRGIVSKFACRVTTTFLLVRCYQKSIIHMRTIMVRFFKNGSSPASFSFIFIFPYKQFLQQYKPCLKKTKKCQEQFVSQTAIQKSMEPDSIQILCPIWDWTCRKTGHISWQKNNFTTNKWEKCLKVFGAEIRTHDVYNMSFLP